MGAPTGAKRPSEVFAARLQALRRRKNWSAQQLADRVKERGGTISRGTIAKLESGTRGSRGVTLDEALELSIALEVPLPLLFLPVDEGTTVNVMPNMPVYAWRLWEWMRGEHPLDASDLTIWREGCLPLWLYDEVKVARKRVEESCRALDRAHDAEQEEDGELNLRFREHGYRRALEELARALAAMERNGLPSDSLLPDRWAAEMTRLGIERGEP